MTHEDLNVGKCTWLSYVLVYVMWVLVLALGIWVLLVSRDAIVGVASLVFVQVSSARAWRISAVEKYYVLGAGFVWLGLMVFSELYFRNGVRRGRLVPRIARVLGAELLALSVFDAILFVTQGLPAEAWLRWLILGSELVFGVICLAVARPSPRVISDVQAGDPD